jgi:hypothetical protein
MLSVQDLEDKYQRAQDKLVRLEQQSSAATAGTGSTDSAGKTEFIKGYEGGFKVCFENSLFLFFFSSFCG